MNTTAKAEAGPPAGRKDDKIVGEAPQFVQGMGLFSATALVMGSMIGSGIFLVPADMSRTLGSPALLIAAWLLTAVMTIIGALSYGELAAMMPKAGGQYVYLREGLGPIWGFLYGWTLFLVIQTGTIAAVGVAFGKFLGVFFPSISAEHWIWHVGSGHVGLNTANLVALGIITLLTVVNSLGVQLGSAVQNVFTSAKVLALLGVIAVGVIAKNAVAIAANFGSGWHQFWAGAGLDQVRMITVGSFWPGSHDSNAMVGALTAVAVVQVGSLFSSDSWNNVTFTAGEVRNPKRNLPLSLALGTGVVLLLYVLCNFVYLSVLPLAGMPGAGTVMGRGIQYAAQDRVATAVMEQVFGAVGAKWMAGAILISTFGCVNGILLSGARVYYAMSQDGLFFKSVGRLNKKTKAPVNSLWVQWAWTCLLCLSGSYGDLLDYVIFAVLIFYILTIVALFMLRFTKPRMFRPYRAFGFPFLPTLYLVLAAWVSVVLLRYKPQYTWPGLILVLIGVPVYWVWKRGAARSTVLE